MRVLEIAAFVTLSGALHVAALTLAPLDPGGSGGGEGGTAETSLHAATPVLAAMVSDWTRPPEISDAPALTLPTAEATPERPAAEDAAPGLRADLLTAPVTGEGPPEIDTRLPAPPMPFAQPAPEALPLPDRPAIAALPVPAQPDRPTALRPAMQPVAQQDSALPQVDTTPPPARHAPTASLRPEHRPAPPPRTAPAQPARKARGGGEQSTTATASPSRQPAASGPSSAQLAQLERQWGAQITTALRRAHRPPGGSRATGTVRLMLTITPAGQVAGVSIAASSGDARLDQAALSAVSRARFPRAPKGLTKSSYRFSQRLTVAR